MKMNGRRIKKPLQKFICKFCGRECWHSTFVDDGCPVIHHDKPACDGFNALPLDNMSMYDYAHPSFSVAHGTSPEERLAHAMRSEDWDRGADAMIEICGINGIAGDIFSAVGRDEVLSAPIEHRKDIVRVYRLINERIRLKDCALAEQIEAKFLRPIELTYSAALLN